MNSQPRPGLRAEVIPLAIVLAFAALTPLAIGLRPWNVVSVMFVTVYLASRVAERAQPAVVAVKQHDALGLHPGASCCVDRNRLRCGGVR